MRFPAPSRVARALLSGFVLVLLGQQGCVERAGGVAPAAAPRRIVSLTPALTEVLFALALGPRVVGVTSYCDWPPQVRALPKVGGYVNPSVEAVLALEPDLVLVSPGPGNRDAALAIRRAGVRVEVVPAETLEDTYRAIETVASICGDPARGRELAGRIRERVEGVARRERSTPRVRTLFCIQVDPIVAAGRGTLPAELLDRAGGENVVEAARYPRLGIESVIALAPEVILQAPMDEGVQGTALRLEAFWRRWPSVPAVSSGRLYIVDPDVMLRPGPRVADAVERLAAILHGEGAPTPGAGARPDAPAKGPA